MEELRYTDVEIELIKKIFEKYNFICKTEGESELVILIKGTSDDLIKWFSINSYIYKNVRGFSCYKSPSFSSSVYLSEIRPDLMENDYVSMFDELYDVLNYKQENFLNKAILHDDWFRIICKCKNTQKDNKQYCESWLNWEWEYRIGNHKLTENMYYIFQLIDRELLVPCEENEDFLENKGYRIPTNELDELNHNFPRNLTNKIYSKFAIPKNSDSIWLLLKQDLIMFDGEKYVVRDAYEI